MKNERERAPGPREVLPGDRRDAVARYVEFRDEDVQALFVVAAEAVYEKLVASDRFAGLCEVELPTIPAGPARRRRFRQRRPTPDRTFVAATPALAMVARAVADIPDEVESSPNGCTAAHVVAQMLANVAGELLRDLLALAPAQQAAHAAYRQTLRLAAELEGLRRIVARTECANPHGCVGIRSPDHWGRRAEDVEVSEVQAVLLRLALTGEEPPGRD